MPEEPQPTVRPTSVATLFVAALATMAGAWVLLSRFYDELQPLPLLAAVTLFLLAIVEGMLAYNTKARIDRKPGTRPVEPLLVARYVLLAKASSLTGAIFTGLYAGVLLWVWSDRYIRADVAANDIQASLLALGSALLLVGAALWLERSCRIPKRGEPPEGPSGEGPRDQPAERPGPADS